MILFDENDNIKVSLKIEIIDNKSNLKRYLNYLNKDENSICWIYIDLYHPNALYDEYGFGYLHYVNTFYNRDSIYGYVFKKSFYTFNDFYLTPTFEFKQNKSALFIECYFGLDLVYRKNTFLKNNKKCLIKLDNIIEEGKV